MTCVSSLLARLSICLAAAATSACMSDKHLIFFTNTTTGIEVAYEPQSTSPARFVFGYKRQEGVIDPIANEEKCIECPELSTDPATRNAQIDKLIEKGEWKARIGSVTVLGSPHSVLAKMNFGAAGGGTQAAAAQWFATGKAAELIAEQPGVTAAVAGDAEIARANAQVNLAESDRMVTLDAIKRAHDGVKEASDAGRLPEGVALLAQLARLDVGEFRVPFEHYKQGQPGELVHVTFQSPASSSFVNVIEYLQAIDSSLAEAKRALESPLKKSDPTANQLVDLDAADRKTLLEFLEDQRPRRDGLVKELGTTKDVHRLLQLWVNRVLMSSNS